MKTPTDPKKGANATTARPPAPAPLSAPGGVRIVGGDYRSRKLKVLDLPGLRPTPDRVRETLFNWLQFKLPNARCLDLFAGSGALGVEALSRGASFVEFVEADLRALKNIQAALTEFNCPPTRFSLKRLDAVAYVRGQNPHPPFDVIFLDPPYPLKLQGQVVQKLHGLWLRPGGLVFAEWPINDPAPLFGTRFQVRREGRAGAIQFALLEGN
jgi:16S rRNA (guanine966-N2)-methyltransferase